MKYKEVRTYFLDEKLMPQALLALGGTAMQIVSFQDRIEVSRIWDTYESYAKYPKNLNVKGYSRLLINHGTI